MKLLMGFIILLVALVGVTGCTQPASTSNAATAAPTTVATTVATAVPTTVPTAVPTSVPTTAAVMTNATAAPAANATVANVTTTAAMMVPTTAAPANVTANVTATATPANMATTVHISASGFTPQVDIVLPGTGVSFVNTDNVSHSVMTVGSNAGMFNSGAIIPGGAFAYTFSQNTGTFVYQLDNNPAINGTIIVQNSPYANPT